MTLVREICAYLMSWTFGVHLCDGATNAVLRDDRYGRPTSAVSWTAVRGSAHA